MPSKEVLTSTLEEIIPADTNLEVYNAEFLERHKDSPKHVRGGNNILPIPPTSFILTYAALRTRHFLKPSDAPFTALFETLSLETLTLKDAIEGQLLLRELKTADEHVKDYNQKSASRFPDAIAFGGKVE